MAVTGEHAMHRSRLRNRYLNEGIDNFEEHEVLELLLFYAIPRKDVNPLAHRLIDHFGSLAAVMDAPMNELCKIPGIGENAAMLLKLIPHLSRRYELSASQSRDIVSSIEEAAELMRPNFIGKTDEELWALCMDGKGKVLACRMIGQGTVNSSSINGRKLMELAINTESSCVILAHNHPSGVAVPSRDDVDATRYLRLALSAAGVILVDHLIFAKGDADYVSLKDSGLLEA